MLDRIALHQTRLRTPGLGLDAKGVALGKKGLVLLPSIERLVAWLALYTSGASLAELTGSLAIEVVKSQLGHREITLVFAAEHSERMDRVAELARASGGYVFTGTSRHFVQYRDAGAPFGYDVRDIAPTDAPLALYHTTFTQHYAPERKVDLGQLLLGLEPRVAPSKALSSGKRWICVEAGLGPALIHYFVRSQVAAEVGVVEWPPASGFDDAPLRRYLFRVEALPSRMVPLLRGTPGIVLFAPAGDGAAVELGFEHPVSLRACPIFPAEGLALIRGGGEPPIRIARLPALGPVAAFARVELRDEAPAPGGGLADVESVQVPLRLAPDPSPWRDITAALVGPSDLGLLRQIAYRLARSALVETRIAFTSEGAVLLRASGIEAIPVGEMFRQIHPRLYLSAGYSHVPSVAPEVLHQSLGSPDDEHVFLRRDGARIGVSDGAFVPLQEALLDAQAWSSTTSESVYTTLRLDLPTVELGSPGFRPLRDVASADAPADENGEG